MGPVRREVKLSHESAGKQGGILLHLQFGLRPGDCVCVAPFLLQHLPHHHSGRCTGVQIKPRAVEGGRIWRRQSVEVAHVDTTSFWGRQAKCRKHGGDHVVWMDKVMLGYGGE